MATYFATKSALSWSIRVPLQLGLSHCRTANSSRKNTSPAGRAPAIAAVASITEPPLQKRLIDPGGFRREQGSAPVNMRGLMLRARLGGSGVRNGARLTRRCLQNLPVLQRVAGGCAALRCSAEYAHCTWHTLNSGRDVITICINRGCVVLRYYQKRNAGIRLHGTRQPDYHSCFACFARKEGSLSRFQTQRAAGSALGTG